MSGAVKFASIRGPQGPKGDKGDKGDQGDPGARGFKGDQGDAGDPGADSTVPGPPGQDGQDGAQGPAGAQGSKGDQGVQGDRGPQGFQGPTGVKGAAGNQGPQGNRGADGPTGPQGLEGPTGPRGLKGDKGDKGDTGAAGPQGIQGLTGPQGPSGDGSGGTAGPQGPKGDTGDAGPQGPKGDTGDTGPAGVQGIQGLTGPEGPTGPTGPKGDTGAQGVQGVQGPQGSQGVKGDTGATGAAGTNAKDRLWVPGSSETVIDEFNDASLDSNWVRLDSSGGAAGRCVMTEGADVLSMANAGSDAAAEFHVLAHPISAMAVGDAVITALKILGPPTTNFSMAAFGLANGAVYGSGLQVLSLNYLGTSGWTVDIRSFTGYNSDGGDSTGGTVIVPHGALFVRLVLVAANTWRRDISLDGVSWLLGANFAKTLTPTHVFIASSSWATTMKSIASFEFVRRVSGVS